MTVIERTTELIAQAIEAEHGALFVGQFYPHGTRAVARSVAEALSTDAEGAVKDRDQLAGFLAWWLEPAASDPPMEFDEMRAMVARLTTPGGQSDSEVRCTGCNTTRPQDVIDCPNCDVPRGHTHRA